MGMKRFRSKKWLVALAAAAAIAALSVGAFAYFTTSGAGTGSASVGSPTGIELSGNPVGTLYPAGADLPVTVSIHNAGSGAQHVGTISGTVSTNGDCLGSDFEVDDITYNDTLAAGDSDTASTKVRMLDSGSDQDACQGREMTINWSSN